MDVAETAEEEPNDHPSGAELAAAASAHSTRHLVDGLHALSIDISRALDIDPPVDLWRPYRGGERQVFIDSILDWFVSVRSGRVFEVLGLPVPRHKFVDGVNL